MPVLGSARNLKGEHFGIRGWTPFNAPSISYQNISASHESHDEIHEVDAQLRLDETVFDVGSPNT